jgi:hypothetical protein
MSTSAPVFERRPERASLLSLRVSAAERREIERLARKSKGSISDVLRDGVARVLASAQAAECVAGRD